MQLPRGKGGRDKHAPTATYKRPFPGGSAGKESACNAGDPVQFLDQEDPLNEEMDTLSSILAWRIPWTEEPGGLQSIALQSLT